MYGSTKKKLLQINKFKRRKSKSFKYMTVMKARRMKKTKIHWNSSRK